MAVVNHPSRACGIHLVLCRLNRDDMIWNHSPLAPPSLECAQSSLVSLIGIWRIQPSRAITRWRWAGGDKDLRDPICKRTRKIGADARLIILNNKHHLLDM